MDGVDGGGWGAVGIGSARPNGGAAVVGAGEDGAEVLASYCDPGDVLGGFGVDFAGGAGLDSEEGNVAWGEPVDVNGVHAVLAIPVEAGVVWEVRGVDGGCRAGTKVVTGAVEGIGGLVSELELEAKGVALGGGFVFREGELFGDAEAVGVSAGEGDLFLVGGNAHVEAAKGFAGAVAEGANGHGAVAVEVDGFAVFGEVEEEDDFFDPAGVVVENVLGVVGREGFGLGEEFGF